MRYMLCPGGIAAQQCRGNSSNTVLFLSSPKGIVASPHIKGNPLVSGYQLDPYWWDLLWILTLKALWSLIWKANPEGPNTEAFRIRPWHYGWLGNYLQEDRGCGVG